MPPDTENTWISRFPPPPVFWLLTNSTVFRFTGNALVKEKKMRRHLSALIPVLRLAAMTSCSQTGRSSNVLKCPRGFGICSRLARCLFILTAALILTACGNPAPAGQAAPQSGNNTVAEGTPSPQSSIGSGAEATAETAVGQEAVQATGQTAVQTGAEPEEAGRFDTAAGTASVFTNPCPDIPADQYPKVDGSTATLPLSYALFQAATGEDEETAMKAISHNKTDSSYRELVRGSCDLVLAYEPSEETKEYIEENGSLQMKPIGRDALVFMINAANPVKSLTEEQIQSIYTGETTNWKELGGSDEEIVAFQRKQNSGSQTLMEKLVMKGISMAEAPSYHYINSMGELLDQVSSYNNQGNAIGYSVYFYARNMYSVPGLEFLSVDGITPSNDTIQDGSYPYVNEFYAVIRDDEPEDSPARLLFDWLTTEGGQELITDTGYVSVLDKHSVKADAAALPLTEKGETSYALKEDQVILLDGAYWFNSPAVHFMNADMTERDLLEGYILTTSMPPSLSETLKVWSIYDPLVLIDPASRKKGLYDIGDGKWLLEPDYDGIVRNASGDYTCYKAGKPVIIYNESGILQVESDCLCLGEYYWIKDDTGYSIRKSGQEIAGHVDVENPGQSRIHRGPDRKIVELNLEEDQDYLYGRVYIYSIDGNLLFKPEYLQSEFEDLQDLSYYLCSCTNTKGLLHFAVKAEGGNRSLIYDIETGDYVWMEDEINTILCNKEGDYAYQIESESGLKILTDSLEPLRAPDGTPYEYCFGMDCYGYRDPGSGNIVVENPDGSIHFEMPYHEEGSEERQGTMIARGVILYTNHDQEDSLYELTSYGNPLCSSDTYSQYSFSNAPGDLSSINQEYTVLRIGEKIFVIQTDTGEVTYQSSEDSLRAKDGPVLVFRSGNWLNFRDPNGNLVMRIFADQNSGD